ncbi:MAG: hypothetical protein ACLSHV_00175 [Hominisplanchenecus sp.]
MGKNVKKVISLVLVFAMILTGILLPDLMQKQQMLQMTLLRQQNMKFIQPREVLFTRIAVLPWQIRQTLSMTARSTRQHRNV